MQGGRNNGVTQVKWRDIVNRNKDIDENRSTVCGYYLNCLGVDLNNITDSLMKDCIYYETEGKHFAEYKIKKVYLDSIMGTTYGEYAGDTWLDTLLRLHRADYYIKNDCTLRGKYFKMLKQDYYDYPPICLIQNKAGSLFVEGNGNHRITFYKIMQFTEDIMERAISKQQFHVDAERSRHTLYWLYAKVKAEV